MIGLIEQKGMTYDHDFAIYSPIKGGKREGEGNNQSRGQKPCLSAQSIVFPKSITFLQAQCVKVNEQLLSINLDFLGIKEGLYYYYFWHENHSSGPMQSNNRI